jgi:hypothetical protein
MTTEGDKVHTQFVDWFGRMKRVPNEKRTWFVQFLQSSSQLKIKKVTIQ